MLSYYKVSQVFGKDKGNFINSIIINIVYLALVVPGIFFMDSPNLSRYWFFIVLIIYLLIYSRLYHLTKN